MQASDKGLRGGISTPPSFVGGGGARRGGGRQLVLGRADIPPSCSSPSVLLPLLPWSFNEEFLDEKL